MSFDEVEIEGETEVERLANQLDNAVALLNMSREKPIDDETFSVLLLGTGLRQCKTCRRALTKSTDGATPEEPCLRCVPHNKEKI